MTEPKIVITQGYWREAGRIFSWIIDGYDSNGVGVNLEALRESKEYVRVEVGGNKYKLNKNEARVFVEKYNSKKKTGSTTLIVVSKDLLK